MKEHEIKEKVFEAYLKREQGKPLTTSEKQYIKAWELMKKAEASSPVEGQVFRMELSTPKTGGIWVQIWDADGHMISSFDNNQQLEAIDKAHQFIRERIIKDTLPEYSNMPYFRPCLECGKIHDANRKEGQVNGVHHAVCEDCADEYVAEQEDRT